MIFLKISTYLRGRIWRRCLRSEFEINRRILSSNFAIGQLINLSQKSIDDQLKSIKCEFFEQWRIIPS